MPTPCIHPQHPSSSRAPARRLTLSSALLVAATILAAAPATAAEIKTPSEFLGFTVGADRTVADYRQIRTYFDALDEASPRVEVEVLGETTLGEELFMAVISSESNVANKERLQEISRKIADPRGLGDAEVEALVAEGKLVLLITCNIHSTEVGASQMAMEWAHALATAEDEETRRRLYKPWRASMDEGWTRFVLETYGFEPKSLDNATIREGGLGSSFDVVVLPAVAKETIESGERPPRPGTIQYVPQLPPEYRGGLDEKGAAAIREFVEGGGTLVALASSSEYVLSVFDIPVRNALGEDAEGFSCPGALLRVEVTPDHPVTWGLPPELAVFQTDDLVFDTVLPGAEMDRWVLATYPKSAGDVLLSGWMDGQEQVTRRAAAVATTWGKGRLVLFGFRVQQRAQTPATFPFLFNALYWSTAPGSRP